MIGCRRIVFVYVVAIVNLNTKTQNFLQETLPTNLKQ